MFHTTKMIRRIAPQLGDIVIRSPKFIRMSSSSIPEWQHVQLEGKPNTLLNVCQNHEQMVVERFGKFSRTITPGWFIAIPMIDQIKTRVDMRELTIPVNPQIATTLDNVYVSIGGTVYIRFVDAYKATYGARSPVYAVSQHAQSSMRSVIGEMSLDELFSNRDKINKYIIKSLSEATPPWGLEVLRYEVREIEVSREIRDKMNNQASAERDRREEILKAEAQKRTLELTSEGELARLRNTSEGKKLEEINIATGKAEGVRIEAEAMANALNTIGLSLSNSNGSEAGKFKITREYINTLGDLYGKSNTMVLENAIGDPAKMLAKAGALWKTIPNYKVSSFGEDNDDIDVSEEVEGALADMYKNKKNKKQISGNMWQ